MGALARDGDKPPRTPDGAALTYARWRRNSGLRGKGDLEVVLFGDFDRSSDLVGMPSRRCGLEDGAAGGAVDESATHNAAEPAGARAGSLTRPSFSADGAGAAGGATCSMDLAWRLDWVRAAYSARDSLRRSQRREPLPLAEERNPPREQRKDSVMVIVRMSTE